MAVWTGVGIIVILCSTSLADPQGDKQKISARFVCSGKQLLYPTHNGADICDGKLQIIVRNKNKDKDFPGASGKISYSNTQCSHSDSDVEVGQINIPQIQADHSHQIEVSDGLIHPTMDTVTCEPGCLKITIKLYEEVLVVGTKEVLPDHDICHLPQGGEAILEVTRSANSAEAKIDDDGQYYIDLGDFISKISVKGKLKRKNDANSNALKYHLLAFLRKRPVDTINYGWPLLNCAKADFSPEAIFGDPVFREFLLDEVEDEAEIFPEISDENRLYITGPKSSCPKLVCGPAELVVYFDWNHHLENYPGFDEDKCDNFEIIRVYANCSTIPLEDIEKTHAVKVLPDISQSGREAYVMSCEGNDVQFNVFDALEKAWRPMHEFWLPDDNSLVTLIGMQRAELFLKLNDQESDICRKAEQLDEDLEKSLGITQETDGCIDKVKELHATMTGCSDDFTCFGENCCSYYSYLINETIAECVGTRVGKALLQLVTHNEEESKSPGEAGKKDCPGGGHFELDQPLAEALNLKSLLDDMHEQNENDERHQNCVSYPDTPELCAQRMATHILNTPMSRYWNFDLHKHTKKMFQGLTKTYHEALGESTASLEYLQDCDYPDVTKAKSVTSPHFYEVKEGAILRRRRNSFNLDPYCSDVIAVHRCLKCEEMLLRERPSSDITRKPAENRPTANLPLDKSGKPNGTPFNQNQTPTGRPFGVSRTPAGTPIGDSKTPTSKPVGESRTPIGQPFGVSRSPARTPIGLSIKPTGTPIGESKTPPSPPVGVSRTLAGKPFGESKTTKSNPIGESKTPTGMVVDESRPTSGTLIGKSGTSTKIPIGKSKTPTGTPVSESRTPTLTPVSESKIPTGTPIGESKTTTSMPIG